MFQTLRLPLMKVESVQKDNPDLQLKEAYLLKPYHYTSGFEYYAGLCHISGASSCGIRVWSSCAELERHCYQKRSSRRPSLRAATNDGELQIHSCLVKSSNPTQRSGRGGRFFEESGSILELIQEEQMPSRFARLLGVLILFVELALAASPPTLSKEKAAEMIKASEDFTTWNLTSVDLSSSQMSDLVAAGYLDQKVNWFIHTHEVTKKGEPYIRGTYLDTIIFVKAPHAGIVEIAAIHDSPPEKVPDPEPAGTQKIVDFRLFPSWDGYPEDMRKILRSYNARMRGFFHLHKDGWSFEAMLPAPKK
jgi:hypothetical protein